MNAFLLCNQSVPGDLVSLNEEGAVLFREPSYMLGGIGVVSGECVAIVIHRHAEFRDWVFVLCGSTFGWITPLSIGELLQGALEPQRW